MKILCHECGASCSTPVPDKTVIRGYVMCPECISKVSSKTWVQFTAEAHQGKTSRFIETPDEELAQEVVEEAAKLSRLQQRGIDAIVVADPSMKEGEYAIVPPIDMSDRVLVHPDGKPLFPENVDIIEQLNPHDRAELRKFRKYVTMRAKYGDATLMKRMFWRKYLLGEK